ncbi:MAG TPA: iron-containing alcohol dehydrogenase [Acetomicrobium sp.]|nr:iron-containing alcohol dehydrogenase [Acetomicrobium sp.]
MHCEMFIPGKAFFGAGMVSKVVELIGNGVKKVFLVTDENLVRHGTAKRLEQILEAGGVEVQIFHEVEPEPSVETTDKAAALARNFGAQAVVGLGGGSCMDVAKAVSVLVTNEGSAANYQGLGLVKKPGVLKIMIPTTAGTGSEVTFTAVLIRRSDGFKGGINDEKLFADYAILDPELTMTAPPKVTAASGMDALIHALEAYTSIHATWFSDMFAQEAIRRIGKWIRIATWNGKNLEARSHMQYAAYLAGLALVHAGVGACHALSYPLGGMFGVGHGIANALLIPYVVRANAFSCPVRYTNVLKWLGYVDEGSNINVRDGALLCAEALDELLEDLELPRTLESLSAGITSEHFPEMAEKALAVSRPMENNPRPFDKELCIKIYEEAMK